jgi:hypothetical protein
MGDQKGYSEAFVRRVAMEAFERVICALKELGGEEQKLGEVADAAFLLWQLAGEETAVAQRTILEYMPMLVEAVYEGSMARKKTEQAVD